MNGSTSVSSSTSAQTGATDTIASDINHISAVDAAHFDDVSARLQGELDAIFACMREDDSGCVNGERDGFMAALQAGIRTWNTIGPESRSNPCYRRLMDYDSVLSQLRTVSRWLFVATEPGQPLPRHPLVTSGGRVVQSQEKHRYIAAQFLAACT